MFSDLFTNLQPIIFTDLDGTLLHPETYSFEDALPALDLIRKRSIPLILCSSKTRAELELYLNRLNLHHPIISENGGGIFIPKGYFSNPDPYYGTNNEIILGTRYEEIRSIIREIRKRLEISVRGFGDMSAEEVSQLTGLPMQEAALARQRDFSEPFIFDQRADERFFNAAREEGLTWTKGRIYCLMGQHDKGKAVRLLKRLYQSEHAKIISIGLGDALNDLPFLQEVEKPVLVQKNDGTYESGIAVSGLVLAPGVGPAGWNKAILNLIDI